MTEDYKERILKGAGELFMKYGVKNITMDDIAHHLSISKKTIYQFFKDKNEMVCCSTRSYLEKEKCNLENFHIYSENLIEKFIRITFYLRESFTKINLSILFDLKRHFPEAWEIYLAYKQNIFYDSTVEALEQGKSEGLFRDNIDVQILSKLRLEEIQLSFDEEVYPRDQFDFREVQDQMLIHFLYGIVTEKGKKDLEKYLNKHYVHESVK